MHGCVVTGDIDVASIIIRRSPEAVNGDFFNTELIKQNAPHAGGQGSPTWGRFPVQTGPCALCSGGILLPSGQGGGRGHKPEPRLPSANELSRISQGYAGHRKVPS